MLYTQYFTLVAAFPDVYNPNRVLRIGDKFGLFFYFPGCESRCFPDEVNSRAESKLSGKGKRKR
jgi:hypothetical protein